MIAIVDYGMGNLRSVAKAFEAGGAKVRVTSQVKDIEKAEKIVLPGVGAFPSAMEELQKRRLVEPIREKIQSGAPYLGICLGLQLLFSESEEGGGPRRARGLGIIPGVVKRFRGDLKVPHIGWNTLKLRRRDCPLLGGMRRGDFFYFVHSYYGAPEDRSWILTTTDYGVEFCSAVWKGSIFAVQFHPEKSQEKGLLLIKNFVKNVGRAEE
ncbi:MAG: imidazole glycerol phosphate synthase subunit HisH [Candidatus Omnitrophica bacterium]|nr:imidazole glycerol phosphate synthase subunit HisH [Candidatus Omnitrophota bacterium]